VLKIPCVKPRYVWWKPHELELLRTLPEEEVARRTGRTAVRALRLKKRKLRKRKRSWRRRPFHWLPWLLRRKAEGVSTDPRYASYVKFYWDASKPKNESWEYDPPPEYDYKWRAD
jgi:hypothetical protein